MKKNLYIEIDTLIDTRLNILINLDANLAIEWYKNGEYKKRREDSFSYLDANIFRRIYKQRNREAIEAPFMTNMLPLIGDYVIKARVEDLESGGDGEITIFVNTYPYDLSDKELDILLVSFSSKLPTDVIVEFLHVETISPMWIMKNVKMMIKYDGLEWVDKVSTTGKLIENNLPDVILVVPDIMYNSSGTSDNYDDYLDTLKELSSPLIQIEFIDVATFCFIG